MRNERREIGHKSDLVVAHLSGAPSDGTLQYVNLRSTHNTCTLHNTNVEHTNRRYE